MSLTNPIANAYRWFYEKTRTGIDSIIFLGDRYGWMRRYWLGGKPDFHTDYGAIIYPDKYPDADSDADTNSDS